MQRLIVPVTSLAIVFTIGIGWYWLVEEFTFLDSVYQAVITLSTVGYEEIEPLDAGGRIFTIFFILAGIGLMFYTATAVVELVVAGEVRELVGRRRTGRRVDRMENHVIVCGYGRVGQKIAHDLTENGVEHVVVDMRAEALDAAVAAGNAVVHGDATEEQILRSAHIERARALVAAADSDVGNTYIALTARSLNPDIFIVARAGGADAEQRMITAGANRVISPYQMAGFRMALSVVQPLMLDFVDMLAARETADEKILAEIVLAPGSGLDGRTIAEAFDPSWGLSLLGVEHADRSDGEIVIGPTGSEVLHEGDRLMVYGSQEAVGRLSERQSVG